MIIRLFENFNEELYTEIFEDDWDEKGIEEMSSDVSTRLANKILQIINKEKFELRRPTRSRNKKRYEYSSHESLFYSYLEIRKKGSNLFDDDYFVIEIYKDDDDYYWVKFDTSGDCMYFKCDQVDGLIPLLKFYDIVK